jgi:DNA-binding response OmpR family regulator
MNMRTDKIKILLVEDEENLGSLLRDFLIAKGYDVILCTDGESAYSTYLSDKFDLCLVDVMLPIKDGLTLAADIRIRNTDIPIIFLTAKSQLNDKLDGFKAGGDDYLTKPFNMEELLLRMKAVLKRTLIHKEEKSSVSVFAIGNFVFDSTKQQLKLGDEIRKLTSKETELMRLLVENSNKVLDRNIALKTIWHDDSYFNARSMDVYITKLRKYLKDDPAVEILNIHGKGFKLVMNSSESVLA